MSGTGRKTTPVTHEQSNTAVRRGSTVHAVLLVLFCLPALLAASCERTDGTPVDGGIYPDGGLVSGEACLTDGDCDDGRYCSTDKICWIDCRNDGDCAFFLPDPSSPNDMYCSRCGRCINDGSEDLLCRQGKKDIPCDSSALCVKEYGTGYVCSLDKYCTAICKTDQDCVQKMGSTYACTDNGDGTGACTKQYACTWDNQCFAFGWGFKCDLPKGTDQFMNTYPPQGGSQIVSRCIRNGTGVDWGKHVDPSLPSYQWHGVWATLLSTAARSTGMPLFAYMNTVEVQYILMKVTQSDGGGLDMSMKYCNIDLINFLDKDEPLEATKIIIPNRYTEFVPVQDLVSASAVPIMAPGASYSTGWLLDVRGADLVNPATDPLPDYINCPGGSCSFQWDQDKDGKPGMTTLITGIVGTGEIYISKRATLMLDVKAVDADHMQGGAPHTFEQGVIGSSPPNFNYSLKYTGMDPERSYFRALRVPEDTSCEDVLKMGNTPGSFIEFQWKCPECM
jgi:hypothetical protein